MLTDINMCHAEDCCGLDTLLTAAHKKHHGKAGAPSEKKSSSASEKSKKSKGSRESKGSKRRRGSEVRK